MPGAPRGIEIKEYVLLLLLRGKLQDDIVLLLAILMRAISLGGNIVATVIGRHIHRSTIQIGKTRKVYNR